MTGTAAAAPTGGNSDAAEACQMGGYQSLARTESPRVAFTSTGECTSYAAKGGTLTPLQTSQPTITYTQEYRYEDADGVVCGVFLILEDFAPLTTYDVFAGDEPDNQFKFKSATTDANGYAIVGLLGAHEGRTFYFTVADITTEVLIAC